MKKHFVRFFSPGTFMAESTDKPIDKWNVDDAVKMARTITERHNATPYGFCFITKSRTEAELDSKETDHSGMYFLGGQVFTIADIEARNDPTEAILLSNMKCNGYTKVVVNTNSWKWTQPLGPNDIVLDFHK